MKAKLADDSFGARVTQLVESAKSMADIARRSGISTSMLKKYMSGTADPTRVNLVALAAAANVRLAWLATGEGPTCAEQPSTQGKAEEAANEHLQTYTPSPEMASREGEQKGARLFDIQPVLAAATEVLTSGIEGTVLALTQNIYEFREKVRLHKEKEGFDKEKAALQEKIAGLEQDMAAIKRRLFADPREDDFKTQEQQRGEQRMGGPKD